MELDLTTMSGVALAISGAIKWVCMRVDKQFADAKAEQVAERAEFKQQLSECDVKHEKCEADRLKILEEVIGLRAEVKAVVRSQGIETERRATEGPR